MSSGWGPSDFDRHLQALRTKKVHLEKLRFPNYRNLRSGEELILSYPITILFGRNGTNKSSILQAVYGAGKGRSIGSYWFETALDAIPEVDGDGRKQSVAHTYRDADGQSVECLKARAPRKTADPDYWEAVKPTQVYGFPVSAGRVSPISVHIEYLDFRQVLPVFDKYFYFPDARHLAQRNRYAKAQGVLRRSYRPQDYLRHRAPNVKHMLALEGKDLSPATLQAASYVLGREYVSGRRLYHDLYWGHEGTTIVLHTKNFGTGYSDAYAGSGESAAITLIETIESVPNGSIIVLDEPETSLHILAQQRMLEVLVKNAVTKDLQFVIATHSFYFGDRLPAQAIRLLKEGADGKIGVIDGLCAIEAFHDTARLDRGKTVFVEDERAKRVILAAFQADGRNLGKAFDVRVHAGGASTLLMDIKAWAATGRNDVLVVFDGDQNPGVVLPDEGQWPSGSKELEALIKEHTKGPNKDGPALPFRDDNERRSYLRFLKEKVFYLPGTTPESIVWVATHVADEYGRYFKAEPDYPATLEAQPDLKDRIRMLARRVYDSTPDAVYERLLARLMDSDLDSAKQIKGNLVAWVRKHAG